MILVATTVFLYYNSIVKGFLLWHFNDTILIMLGFIQPKSLRVFDMNKFLQFVINFRQVDGYIIISYLAYYSLLIIAYGGIFSISTHLTEGVGPLLIALVVLLFAVSYSIIFVILLIALIFQVKFLKIKVSLIHDIGFLVGIVIFIICCYFLIHFIGLQNLLKLFLR